MLFTLFYPFLAVDSQILLVKSINKEKKLSIEILFNTIKGFKIN
jgi:hypothetical protein